MWSLRIVSIDYYISTPISGLDPFYSEFRGAEIRSLPIIRVFGSFLSGHKVCLHIHGVYPYICLPYDSSEPANGLMYQIASGIDKAVNVSMGRSMADTQHVYQIKPISGIPMYGYHAAEQPFFKVCFYNPSIMRKAIDLLQNGSVMNGRIFQPHDAHLNFTLQFMIDYNLHGMAWLKAAEIRFRRRENFPLDVPESAFLPDSVQMTSTCAVEGDLHCSMIQNISAIGPNLTSNPGLAGLFEAERQRRRDQGLASQLTPHSAEEPRPACIQAKSHCFFARRMRDKLAAMADDSSTQSPLDTTLGGDAMSVELLDILMDLKKNAAAAQEEEDGVEEGSALSQMPRDVEGEGEDEGEKEDLSLSLMEDPGEFLGLFEDNDSRDEIQGGLRMSSRSRLGENEAQDGMTIDPEDLSLPLSGSPQSDIEDKDQVEEDFSIADLIELEDRISSSNSSTDDDLRRFPLSQIERFNTVPQLDGADDDQPSTSKPKAKYSPLKIIKSVSPDKQMSPIMMPRRKRGRPPKIRKIQLGPIKEEADLFAVTPIAPLPSTSKQVDALFALSPLSNLSSPSHFSPPSNPSTPKNPPKAVLVPSKIPSGAILTPLNPPPCPKAVRVTAPPVRHQQPFYSRFEDRPQKVLEVGHNFLKVPSRAVCDLEEMQSDVGFRGLEQRRVLGVSGIKMPPGKSLRIALAGYSKMTLTPSLQPPSVERVRRWKPAQTPKKKPEEKSPKLRLVASPEGDEPDLELTLTLTPGSLNESKSALGSPRTVFGSSQDSKPTPGSSQDTKPTSKSSQDPKPTSGSSQDVTLTPKSPHGRKASSEDSFQITGALLDNTHGFKLPLEDLRLAKGRQECQNLTVMALELHVATRDQLRPDPLLDRVRVAFYALKTDADPGIEGVVEDEGEDELGLIWKLVDVVRSHDPDICTGYEIETLSWGYLMARCTALGVDGASELGRVRCSSRPDSNPQPTGRIMLDAWRLLRHEAALQSYTFENIVYHVLHCRLPRHSFQELTLWFENLKTRHLTLDYYAVRAKGLLAVLEQLDLIGRTAELARLFGIQFYEVLSRGSQFRVESMMLRLAKPLGMVPLSPSVEQRAHMRSPEFLPLILEPESRFYVDPVIVLDFQSLYPSIIIAYNYCFTTCIGRVECLKASQEDEEEIEFGTYRLKIPKRFLRKVGDEINFSPCGVGFVQPRLRRGILPVMLQEILQARLMVKRALRDAQDPALRRVLHSRQLGLKLIANVTYGYTAANFSGRMPCVEVGDSVVSKGRETLEQAIELVNVTKKWGARVVYGDTDSLFVLVKGRSREEAFRIGAEIAEEVTARNPQPVKLKLEKVYHPCILQTKKRYVGYMYESADQSEPVYNAKGIETVRRDGCPAVAKILEKCLRILFETRDLSLVKKYAVRQFGKVLANRVNLQDLVFAREFRGLSGYRPGACVPALELCKRWLQTDPRAEPRRSERVPYVIVHGPPGLPLIRLVRSPTDLLLDPGLRPNAPYYLSRVILPPLNRCLSLVGVDAGQWLAGMPRRRPAVSSSASHQLLRKSTIAQYFSTQLCPCCEAGQVIGGGVCGACAQRKPVTALVLAEKSRRLERALHEVQLICQSCCRRPSNTNCCSLDCPVLFRLKRAEREAQDVPYLRQILLEF